MEAFVLSFVAQYGYLALSALIFLENVFPPIPSEAILPAAGFMSSVGSLWLPAAILAATIGSLLGAYVLCALGYVAGSAWESASVGATQAIDVMTLVVVAVIVVVAAIWVAKRAIPAIKKAVCSEGAE